MFPFIRILAACSLCSTALAQSSVELPRPPGNDEQPLHLDDFVVSTHPYGRSRNDIAQPTSVVTGATLDRNQSTSLGEVLADQPGVSSTWFGPGASRPIIRALGGPRVAVLQNGTDTLDASVISPDHA